MLHASPNTDPGRRISNFSLLEQELFLILYLKILHSFLFFLTLHEIIHLKFCISFHRSRFLQLQLNTGCVVRYSTQAGLGALVSCLIPWQKNTHLLAQRHRNWKALNKLTPRNRLTTPPKETVK